MIQPKWVCSYPMIWKYFSTKTGFFPPKRLSMKSSLNSINKKQEESHFSSSWKQWIQNLTKRKGRRTYIMSSRSTIEPIRAISTYMIWKKSTNSYKRISMKKWWSLWYRERARFLEISCTFRTFMKLWGSKFIDHIQIFCLLSLVKEKKLNMLQSKI